MDSHSSSSDEERPEKRAKMPKKAEHRMRAHINPLNDTPFPYPLCPKFVDWSLHFPVAYGRP
jgi:tRNA (guanine-N7-)-methyltransferase